jgi:hypothetical protein
MNSPVTLQQVFLGPERGAWPREELETRPEFSALKESLTLKAPGLAWPGTVNKIMGDLGHLFDISLSSIMVRAWNNFRILFKYLHRENYPPGDIIYLDLHEHTIKSEHHPTIEILLNGASLGKIMFHITVSLTLKGVTLKIQEGKIKEITPVSCEGKGTFKLGEFVILEKKTGPVPLPARFDLGDGIPIAA